MKVFEITTEISKQVFPVVLDINNPAFLRHLKKLSYYNEKLEQCDKKKTLSMRRVMLGLKIAVCFSKLFFMKSFRNDLPADFRVKPTW